MKNKKGFTLIELLAVIIILAIIALVAIPIILNMIENGRKAAAKDTAYGYIDAIEYSMGLSDINAEGYTDINIPDNNDEHEFYTVEEIQEQNIKVKGKVPESGVVVIKNRKVTSASLCIGKYKADYDGREVRVTKSSDCTGVEEEEEQEVVIPDETPCVLATETKDNKEYYYIDSVEDMYAFAASVNGGNSYSGKVVELRNSLDFSGYTSNKVCTDNDNASGFTPIGTSDHPFSGTFEGGAKTISNLTINRSSSDNVGLFGYTSSANLKGITISNLNVKGKNYVSGIVGYKFGGTISDVIVESATVEGNSRVSLAIGETVGNYSTRGTDSNILVKNGTVKANTYGAAVIGEVGGYATSSNLLVEQATVTATSGALVTGNTNEYVTNIGASVKAKYNNETGTFAENNIDDLNYYETFGLDTYIGGDNNTNGYYFDYNNKNNVVLKKVDSSSFELTMTKDENGYYPIKNIKEWRLATANLSKKYKITKDLDFKNKKFYMMGSTTNPFTGSFDGGTKTISNVTINATGGNNIGLFGYTSKATLKGIVIDNITIKGNNNVGGIVGNKYAGTLKDVVVKNAKITGESNVSLAIGRTVGDYSNRGQDENILIKNGTVKANTYGASAVGKVDDYITVTGVIVEQAKVTANSGAIVTGNTNEYVTKTSYSTKAKYNNESNGFPESDINDINYYETVGLDTWIAGDNNSTGYVFDYDDNKNVVLKAVDNFSLTMEKDSNNYYLITNEDEWKLATANLSGKYKLTKNLNFENNNFYMMGSANNAYTGSFDGGAKTISNVTINATKGNDIGVFGYISKAALKGIVVDNVTIKGNNYVGGIVGYNYASSLNEALVKSANITGNTEVAGVIGINSGDYSNRGQVNNILVKNATVKANDRGAGIMGFLDFYSYNSNAIVENATITATSGAAISGYNYQNSFSNSYYSNQVKFNGDTQTNGFDSSNIDNLSYYKDKIETKLNGDNNNTGYFFDSVNGKVVIVPSNN